MRKNKKAILSLALAASLFLSGATSHAAFSAGQKITKFKYNNKNGTVSVMADVDGSSAGTYIMAQLSRQKFDVFIMN